MHGKFCNVQEIRRGGTSHKTRPRISLGRYESLPEQQFPLIALSPLPTISLEHSVDGVHLQWGHMPVV